MKVYYFPTPNGWKVTIALEELGLPYDLHFVDIQRGEQKQADFLSVNPNGRIPALVDGDLRIFESGAILQYLAEKTGRLLPQSREGRYAALQWLFWQMAGLGPMAGQAHHFLRLDQAILYASDRYVGEAARLYGVLDTRLAASKWLAGEEYSIADIACFGWVHLHDRHGQSLADYPGVRRWYDAMIARPAVQRGLLAGRDRIDLKVQEYLNLPVDRELEKSHID